MLKSIDIVIQVFIPLMKVNEDEKTLIIEDPSEFVNLSEDVCEYFESDNIKTNLALLLIAIEKNVDGMSTFIVDFYLDLLQKVV